MSLDRGAAPSRQAVPLASQLRAAAVRVGDLGDVVDRRARGANAAAIAAATLALGLLAAMTWGAWGDLSRDLGFDWLAADRMASGELPYRDFTYYYGPLAVGLLAVVFAVAGTSVASATSFGLVLAAAAVGLTFQLARRVTTIPGAAIAATLAGTAAFATGNKGLIQPHSVSVSVAVVACLLTLELAARHAASPSRWTLPAAAAAAGAACLTRPEFAAAIVIALAAWLGLRLVSCPRSERPAARRDLLVAAGIALGVPLAIYATIAIAVGPAALADGMLARDELRAGADDVLRASAPLTLASALELVLHTMVYAAGAAALVGLGWLAERGGRARTLALSIVAAAGLGLALALIVRPAAVQSRLDWAYEWIPLGAAAAAVMMGFKARTRKPWVARDQIAFLLCMFLAVLAAKTYGAFDPQPNALRAQGAIYALPFAAVFLVWLHGEALAGDRGWMRSTGLAWVSALALAGVALTAWEGSKESGVIRGPGGALAALPGQAAPLQALLLEIERRTSPGEAVLLAPQMTGLYVLADRPNPLTQLSLIPGALATAADEDAAIARLREVRLVAVDARPRAEYGQGAFGQSFDRRLGAWLQREFRRVATFRGAGDGALTIDLWQRSAT